MSNEEIAIFRAFSCVPISFFLRSFTPIGGTFVGHSGDVPAADNVGGFALQALVGMRIDLFDDRRSHADILTDLQWALAFCELRRARTES